MSGLMFALSALSILLLSGTANAQGAAGAARAAMSGAKGGITLTGYSANCEEFDGPVETMGGKDESPSGLKPREHTIDGSAEVVLAALPQEGGTSDLYGKCFTISHPDVDEKKIFYGGDRYGKGSNGQSKIDISHECTAAVKSFKKEAAAIQPVECPENIGARQPAGI